MTAELWRLTMETGQVIDVLVGNISKREEIDQKLFSHVPSHTTIYSRELLTVFHYAAFSFRVADDRADR
jgi:hypothetical protein